MSLKEIDLPEVIALDDKTGKPQAKKDADLLKIIISDKKDDEPQVSRWQRLKVRAARLKPSKNWLGGLKKLGKTILILAFLMLVVFAGYWVGQEFLAVKHQANSAVTIAKSVQTDVGELKTKVDGYEKQVSLLSNRMDAQEQVASRLVGRADANDGVVTTMGKTISELTAEAKDAIGKLFHRADSNDKVVDLIVKDVSESKAQSEKAIKIATQANARQDARIKAESQQYKRMLAYIRGANPKSPLAEKSDKEIDRLLADGKWNVEPQIQAEYQRLKDSAVLQVQQTADAAQETGRNAQATADQAIDAGTTAVSAIDKIAKQKTGIVGRSVTKATKQSIAEEIAEYQARYGSDK